MIKPPGHSQFNFLIISIFIILFGILGTAWYMGLGQKTTLLYIFIYLLLSLLTALFITLLIGLLGFYLLFKKGRLPEFFRKPATILLNIAVPLILYMGKIIHLSETLLQANIIYWLNMVNRSNNCVVKPSELLILIPHCLQNNECKYHVVHDINNCRKCGKCQIQDLLSLKEEMNLNMHVVTGGTLARQIVKKNNPKAVIAIACERDLLSGMVDIFPYRVAGIINQRPNGPCFNTSLDISALKKALNELLLK